MINIGVAATSAVVGQIELALGVERIASAGFNVVVHPSTRSAKGYFAGSDEERARSFFDIAANPAFDVLWCARGGYGATRILSLLDTHARKHGKPPRKLLVGYSDVTALHEYVRRKWGWWTLHASMPGTRDFGTLSRTEWNALIGWVAGRRVHEPWGKLQFAGKAPRRAIEGELVGGNLSVWNALIGTPHQLSAKGKILFVEDVDERPYRVDRALQQLVASGGLEGVRAIVLGNWSMCEDSVNSVLKKRPAASDLERVLKSPRPEELKPLRKKLPDTVIREIFADACARAKVPLAWELPCGHGPGHAPLPLGARYRLSPDGELELRSWTWLGRPLE